MLPGFAVPRNIRLLRNIPLVKLKTELTLVYAIIRRILHTKVFQVFTFEFRVHEAYRSFSVSAELAHIQYAVYSIKPFNPNEQ